MPAQDLLVIEGGGALTAQVAREPPGRWPVLVQEDSPPVPIRTWSTSVVHLGRYRLRSPLVVGLEQWESEVIATWAEVELWSSATTDFDAINDLKDAIADLYEELSATDNDKLGPLPLRWKRALIAIVGEAESE